MNPILEVCLSQRKFHLNLHLNRPKNLRLALSAPIEIPHLAMIRCNERSGSRT